MKQDLHQIPEQQVLKNQRGATQHPLGMSALRGADGKASAMPRPFQLKATEESALQPEGTSTDAGFGFRINHEEKTMVITANVYTSSELAHSQAKSAAATWNAKTAVVGEYTISFDINVISAAPISEDEVMDAFGTVDFYNKRGKLRKKLYQTYREKMLKYRAINAAEMDPIGKSYTGTNGLKSRVVDGERYVGGQTLNGKHADMNIHRDAGNMGQHNDLVVHEFGHYFGLDDKDGDHDGHTDPYYPGDGGTMEYTGMDLYPISDEDVETIMKYAKDMLENTEECKESPISLLETIGNSDGQNPLGISNDNPDE